MGISSGGVTSFEKAKNSLDSRFVSREAKEESNLLELPPEERYREAHTRYIEKYGQGLPAPDKALGVVTVVPVYNELGNDNFWRLLRSLVTQEETKESHEVLYVVNNGIKGAKAQTEAFANNQKTLDILRTLEKMQSEQQDGNVDFAAVAQKFGFTKWEEEVFAAAVARKVHIHGIDASSQDKAIEATVFNPRGRARDIGGHIAHERLRGVGNEQNGRIDFIDADCYLSPNYYSALERRGPEDKLLVKGLVAYTPDVFQFEETGDDVRDAAVLVRYLREAVFEGRVRYSLGYHNNEDDEGHGPTIVTDPASFEKVGGYPHWLKETENKAFHARFQNPSKNASLAISEGNLEDYRFKANLLKVIEKKDRKPNEATVFVSHRIREGNVDGEELRNMLFDRQPVGKVELDRVAEISDHTDAIFRMLIEKAFVPGGSGKGFDEIRARAFHRESVQRRVSLQRMKKLLPIMLESSDMESMQGVTNREKDFLLANPSLFHLVKKVERITANETDYSGLPALDRTMRFLETYLPDYFKEPPSAEPDLKKTWEELFVNSDKKQPSSYVLRDYVHLARALYDYKQQEKQRDQQREQMRKAA